MRNLGNAKLTEGDRFDNMKSAIAIHRLLSCEYLRFWQICKECISQAYQRRSLRYRLRLL
ncbi:hypothetical protein [Nodularia sp. UHCC 0506]|uniref:hypothetical protein n=1 Tax=Nodularia sp. UHCC 0506 TaxID=3110243 RepID=UPI002B1EBE93|nr:hypothetical protein [Nodularia sp. UHCC 0506]MEA5513466.1 hypothetical protein [Nodularia sp. UHCC 0506]